MQMLGKLSWPQYVASPDYLAGNNNFLGTVLAWVKIADMWLHSEICSATDFSHPHTAKKTRTVDVSTKLIDMV